MARKVQSDHVGMLFALGATAVFGWLAFKSKNRIQTSGTARLEADIPYRFTFRLPELAKATTELLPSIHQALLAVGASDIRTNTLTHQLSFIRVSPVDTSLAIGSSPFSAPALSGARLESVERLDGKGF